MTTFEKMAAPLQRRRVMFVINSLAGGGAERVMTTLLKASHDRQARCDLHLVLLDKEPAAYEVPAWVTVHQLDCRHSLLRSIVYLWSLLRHDRPNAVLSFLTRANVASVIACRLLKVPVVISERVNTTSHLSGGPGAKLAKLLVRYCYPRAQRIIAVSPGVASDLCRSFHIRKEKVVVISNPIDRDEILRQAEAGSPVTIQRAFLMAMGRLVPNKNFSMLISAYHRADLAEDLLILGEGPEREHLSAQIGELGLTGRVHMPGFSSNPFGTLRHASVFILPSNAEGFPNSLLEAMSLGVPVISTNCMSGPSEVLANLPREDVSPGLVMAEYGIVVPTDHIEHMAAALRAMADPECRRQYRQKARARAGDFSVERAKLAYWHVIDSEMGFWPDRTQYSTADVVSN